MDFAAGCAGWISGDGVISREEEKRKGAGGRVYIADPSFFSLFVSFLSLCVLFSFIDGNTGRRGEVLFLPICGEEEYREVYWKEASYLLEVEVTFSGRHRCLLLPEDGTGAPVVHHVLWNTEQKQRNGIDEPKSCTIRRLRVNPHVRIQFSRLGFFPNLGNRIDAMIFLRTLHRTFIFRSDLRCVMNMTRPIRL